MADELFQLQRVPIFASGTWNNDPYTDADLDAMVQAFAQVGFRPPVKLGHDERQPMAGSDAMPALGWVNRVYRVGSTLYADLVHLPRRVYEAVKRKAYDRVSAEVFWNYTESGKSFPRVLKALALLGAEIPAVTSLDALASLYGGTGEAHAYSFPMADMPVPAGATAPIMAVAAMPPRKPKAQANYREGQRGGYARCGACKYFNGPWDAKGGMVGGPFVGSCNLVEGDVASNFTCDLQDAREAFGGEPEHKHSKTYDVITVPIQLEVSVAAGGAGGAPGGPPADEAGEEPELDENGKPKMGPDGKPVMKKKAASPVDDLAVEEQPDGQFCVMKKGQKVQCFPTPEEAEALLGEMKAAPDKGEKKAAEFARRAAALAAHVYTIEERDGKFCLMAKSTGRTLGCHATRAEAEAQEMAVQASKAAAHELLLDAREVEGFCQPCARRMRTAGISKLRLWVGPRKTYGLEVGHPLGSTRFFAGPGMDAMCGEMGGDMAKCEEAMKAKGMSDPAAFCADLRKRCAEQMDGMKKEQADETKKEHATDALTRPAPAPGAAGIPGAKEVKKMANLTPEQMEARLLELAGQVETLQGANVALGEKLAKSEETAKSYKQMVDEQEGERVKSAEEARQAQNGAWIQGMAEGAEARILPAERPYVAFLLDVLTAPAPEGVQVKTYAEKVKDGEAEKEVQVGAAEIFKRLFALRSKDTIAKLFAEQSAGGGQSQAEPGGEVDPDQAEQDLLAKARELVKAEPGKYSLSAAYRKVLGEAPDKVRDALTRSRVRPEGEARAKAEAGRYATRLAPKKG